MKRMLYSLSAIVIIVAGLNVSGKVNQVMGFSRHYTFSDTTIAGAQPDVRLTRYQKELKNLDISISAPEGFHSIDMRGRKRISENMRNSQYRVTPTIDIIEVGLESDNNDAVFCFPYIMYGDSAGVIRKAKEIAMELRQYFNHEDSSTFANRSMDIKPFVRVIADEDMSKYANADTAMVYDIKLKNAFLDQYPYMVGVYLRKKSYPALTMKVALTEDSYKDKDKYVQLLLDNIKYGNNPAEYLIKAEELTAARGWKDSLD